MTDFLNFLSTSTGMITVTVALVVLLLAATTTLVVKGRRDLPPASDRPELGAPTTTTGEDEADSQANADIRPTTPIHDVQQSPQAGQDEPLAAPSVTLDQPESRLGRMERLRARLAGTGRIGQSLLAILSRGNLSEADWEEIEDTLLVADLGMDATEEIMQRLRTAVQVKGDPDTETVRSLLREELLELVGRDWDRSLNLEPADVEGKHPAVVLMVGVNGTGKTTTVGKLARLLVAEGKTVVLGAADTFRAAAAEQLTTWGERVGVETVRAAVEGRDPASVAYDAVLHGQQIGADVVLVDTAGRLQNKSTLMDELGKVKRVIEKLGPVAETLLVLDATTGQNGMRQAQVFSEVTQVSGVVLTKLDGSAKGGIVVSVQRELGVPVKLVGLGEGPDDLAPFNPEDFVDAIIG